jgi:hypothetical protein
MSIKKIIWPYFESDKTKLNALASVREGTIPTERPQLVDEITDNFCG